VWPLTDKLASLGHEVHIFSGNRIHPITPSRIGALLKKEKYDKVVSQGVVANVYARLASLVSGVPSLVTVHSDINFDYPNQIIRAIYKLSDILLRFRTSRYIAVSQYLKDTLIKSGVDGKRIDVVYNSVDMPADYRNKKRNPEERLVIGSVGRLHSVKNYMALVEAAPDLKDKNLVIRIWGDGEEKGRLQKKISYLRSQGVNNIELMGETKDVWSVLPEIDIYIQPSLSEGFGITVVEAMLAGKPVIVSPKGSLPELVVDGQTGIVMKGADSKSITEAIKSALNNVSKLNIMAEAGQEYARKNFAIKKWVQLISAAYSK
jgi:glycosyltransferase involved in cell wall biosynthesis